MGERGRLDETARGRGQQVPGKGGSCTGTGPGQAGSQGMEGPAALHQKTQKRGSRVARLASQAPSRTLQPPAAPRCPRCVPTLQPPAMSRALSACRPPRAPQQGWEGAERSPQLPGLGCQGFQEVSSEDAKLHVGTDQGKQTWGPGGGEGRGRIQQARARGYPSRRWARCLPAAGRACWGRRL